MKWHQLFFWLSLGTPSYPAWTTLLAGVGGSVGRRVDYLAPTVYLTDIVLLATLISWGLESFFSNQDSGIRN